MKRMLLALALLSSASSAEEFDFTGGTSGWVKADFTLVLLKNGVSQSTASVTITEVGSTGVYVIGGLPDSVATNSDRYTFSYMDPNLRWFQYSYPNRTRTPQNVVWAPEYTLLPGPPQMRVGDRLPRLDFEVTGLAADPTLSDINFTMRNARTKEVKIDAAAGTVTDVVAVVHNSVDIYCRTPPCTTYNAILHYNWGATDTDTAGEYEGWFTITGDDGLPLSNPPRDKIKVSIFD